VANLNDIYANGPKSDNFLIWIKLALVELCLQCLLVMPLPAINHERLAVFSLSMCLVLVPVIFINRCWQHYTGY